MQRVTHYFDYKSPYAYLAQDDTLALATRFDTELVLLPYTLDIPSYLGSAEVDERGQLQRSSRNAHQWRRVRYSYMDCRREANRRGLLIRGTRKIFDSTIAHIGFLYAQQAGKPLGYHQSVFMKFWRRELDIEHPDVIESELEAAGVASAGFREILAGAGRAALTEVQREAEDAGVFGVPTYLVDDQLYWGAERLERVREHLAPDTTA